MKRGKKYVEAAKAVDKQHYMIQLRLSALLKKSAQLNLTKQSKFISEQAAMDVMQISRSVVQ